MSDRPDEVSPAPPSAAELAALTELRAEVRAELAELAALTELRAELARICAVHGEGAKIDEERVRASLAAPPLRVV